MAWYWWVYIIGAAFYLIIGGRVIAKENGIGGVENPWFDILAPIVMAAVWPIALLFGLGMVLGKRGEK